jgi:lactonase
VTTIDNLYPGGLALHPDGRLFIAALDLNHNVGAIFAVKPDGTEKQTIIAADAGYMPNDLVFNNQGGFYFSDFKGISTEPTGGIYYVPPDLSKPIVVLPHLSMANGVTLSPDGKTLWATEFGRNLLHRIDLADATTIAPISSSIPYRFTGPAPDSMRADADGNVYVAIYGQGRVMAFNKNGIPIGQVLLPGREQGHNLLSTSPRYRSAYKHLVFRHERWRGRPRRDNIQSQSLYPRLACGGVQMSLTMARLPHVCPIDHMEKTL